VVIWLEEISAYNERGKNMSYRLLSHRAPMEINRKFGVETNKKLCREPASIGAGARYFELTPPS